MSDVKVTEVLALPDDVLQVVGEHDGETITAFGWQSAMTNHYGPEAYDADGALLLKTTKKGAPGDPECPPREMTSAEQLAYCRSLLEAVVAAAPQPLNIAD